MKKENPKKQNLSVNPSQTPQKQPTFKTVCNERIDQKKKIRTASSIKRYQSRINEFYTVRALGRRWHCHPNSIKNWIKQGLITYIRTPGGRKILLPKNAIHEYERNQIQNRKYK